jgi:hypothetical protein
MFSLTNIGLSFILVSILTPSCSPPPPTPTPANYSVWSVGIKTSGGFAGVGNGNVLITSDGKIKYEPPHIPGKSMQVCDERLSAEEIRNVSAAVNQSKPEGWNVPGLNIAAPDAFGYELELHRDTKEDKVKWYDNTTAQLPDDLKKLNEAVNRAKVAATKKCAGSSE